LSIKAMFQEVRAAGPGIGLSRGNGQPGAGIVGDQKQEIFG
jgi:hypothetical protein